ncbi:Glyoxylase, beta-lactamase superfamily II [Paramicrobacterium humi]|uniref:Glyoxylase, beta-lactamase superfamily II n=1 Tax=Paramicrobacterium humi TaxID=640635 RepID=A0A1H4KIN2_9MICO|nr:MBL fold metallo-hydrolase [Microbacterium humi]SEB58380.1 Glyoxylase, beta-lactamase superfamily II [Microbacterium humi]
MPAPRAGEYSGDDVVEVTRGVYRVGDTCNVYLIVADGSPSEERTAVAVDFGAGRALEVLADLAIDRITDVVMTHHHRDQAQGLPLAVEHGARVHVPPVEVELFRNVEEMWETRPLDNDYNLRQDRFSLLESVPITGVVPEYRSADFGGVTLYTLPTPGHTIGSVTYILERDGQRIGFSGDLIYSPGKVWSLAASQWSYTAHEGPAITVLSCYLLQDENLNALLPSHGDTMWHPDDALGLLAARMQYHVDSRRWHPWDLHDRLRNPFIQLTDHLLLNRSSLSCCYIVLSDTGEALIIDYGYDMTTGLPTGTDRAARRPWLASLPALKRQFGVTRIAVALTTHYHDDHVAGLSLLRDVEGTEIWSPSNVAPILDDPWKYDLPCQWYEPIHADRVLPTDEAFTWHEHTIRVHEQPGHTLFASAFELHVDGVTVVFTGDQQENLGIPGERHEILNYQYRNRFRIHDYRASAELYRRIAPGLLLSGHWEPRHVDDGYLDYLAYAGEDLIEMHEALLPLDELDLGADGVMARLIPYRSRSAPGAEVTFTATVRNPHHHAATAVLRPVVPAGWQTDAGETSVDLAAAEEREVSIVVRAGDGPARRCRVALDVTIGSLRLGQHTEALVDIE